MRSLIKKDFICEKCGKRFVADERTTIILCKDCKHKHNLKVGKALRDKKRTQKEIIRNRSDIHKIMWKMVDYNKQHGTNYQYGEFTHRFGI